MARFKVLGTLSRNCFSPNAIYSVMMLMRGYVGRKYIFEMIKQSKDRKENLR